MAHQGAKPARTICGAARPTVKPCSILATTSRPENVSYVTIARQASDSMGSDSIEINSKGSDSIEFADQNSMESDPFELPESRARGQKLRLGSRLDDAVDDAVSTRLFGGHVPVAIELALDALERLPRVLAE